MLRPYFTFLILGVLLPCLNANRTTFFRRDYTYMEEYDAFYKMHWDVDVNSWNSAYRVCEDEGSKLFYPKMEGEWTIAQNPRINIQTNVTHIFIGLHNQFQLGEFITIDGQSTETPLGVEDSTYLPNDCVMMNITTGIFTIENCSTENPTPFICKKIEDISCPTIDRGYKYVKPLNKCYKVHNEELYWDDAMRTCFIEGGILAVLENNIEMNAIRPLVNVDTFYYIGFRKMFNIDKFYTIKGKIYENSFFREWYENQEEKDRDCGLFLYSDRREQNEITAAYCNKHLVQFICEMDLI